MVVELVIDVDGSVYDAKIVRNAHPLLDEEALRIINSMPKWTPGIHLGKPVQVRVTVPVIFRLPRQ